MLNKIIRLILKILPAEIVSIINDESLKELDKRGWIIWVDEENNTNG